MTQQKLVRARPGSVFRTFWILSCLAALAGCGGSPQERAQAHYERGIELVAKHDDLGARNELLDSVRRNSEKVEAWRALAGVERRLKVTQSEFVALKRLVELDANDLDARLRLAQIMISGGAAEPALQILDAAAEDKPNAQLHALKALAYQRQKNNSAAFREAQTAYEIDPKNQQAVGMLVAKKLADGDSDAALRLLDALTIDEGNETSISLQKMQAYFRKGDLRQVESLLRRVIAVNPGNATYQAQLIQLLLSQRRFDEAEKEYRSRADANSKDSKVILDLVRFLNIARGPDAARRELGTRIKTQGNKDGDEVVDLQIALAELDVAQSKVADAINGLRSIINSGASSEKKKAVQLKLAELYLGKANMTDAEPLVSDILAKDPRNSTALMLRSAMKIDRNQLDSAISDLREALNDKPQSPDLLIVLATAYERAGNKELADRQYADALKYSRGSADVTLRYAAFLQRSGDSARAEEVLADAVNRYPSNLQILVAIGQLRLARKDWLGASAVADSVARLDGGASVSSQLRAGVLAGQNKIDESIASLEDAHKASPTAVPPVLALGSAYVNQGKADKAVRLLEETIKAVPDNVQLLVFLGQVKVAQSKLEEAIQFDEQAIDAQPKDPAGYRALAEIYLNQKNWSAAERVLTGALKEIPFDVNLRLGYAAAQILKGDQKSAIDQYEAILKDQPNSLIAINNLVSLLLDHRSDKPSLDRAFELSDLLRNSSIPQFRDTYAWALYRKDDFAQAAPILEDVVAKLPNLAAVHYHLGMSYGSLGQLEKSVEQLKLALSLEPDGTPLKETIQAALK